MKLNRFNILFLILFALVASRLTMHREGSTSKVLTEAKTITDYTDNYQGDRRICKPERKSFGFPINY